MTTGKPAQLSQTVTFSKSKPDLALLKAIQQRLADGSESTFSDLCKEALRHFLLATETSASVIMLMDLQQQVTELQVKLDHAEQALTTNQANGQRQIDDRFVALTKRLEQLEQEVNPDRISEAPPAKVELKPDPLLSRLGPLLEEF